MNCGVRNACESDLRSNLRMLSRYNSVRKFLSKDFFIAFLTEYSIFLGAVVCQNTHFERRKGPIRAPKFTPRPPCLTAVNIYTFTKR